jgi:hypothetical protein
MGRIEDLAERYFKHISTPWQRTVSGAERVIMVVYDPELERPLRTRKSTFEQATTEAGYEWFELDLTRAFATWMAADEYREAYFEVPDDLNIKLERDFPEFVAQQVREVLVRPEVGEKSVVAVSGVGALFGFTRVSELLKRVEGDIRGRLVVFFPGTYESRKYRLFDAREGWDYLAVPITQQASGDVQ